MPSTHERFVYPAPFRCRELLRREFDGHSRHACGRARANGASHLRPQRVCLRLAVPGQGRTLFPCGGGWRARAGTPRFCRGAVQLHLM